MTRPKPAIVGSVVDRDFGNWLAGFIDGEGSFYITRDSAGGTWRARFALSLRADDRTVLELCQSVTGIGSLHDYMPTGPGRLVTRWNIQSHSDCRMLCALLDSYPLRAKKARDYAIWREAVVVQDQIRPGRADNTAVRERLSGLKADLLASRASLLEGTA